jgi:hypothetical protein
VDRALQGKNVSPATQQIIDKALNNTMLQGKSWPDLVLVRDSGRPPEFRVQCEIDITNPEDANTLETKLYGSSSERDYKGAYNIVKNYILGDASPSFKEIVEIGFMGQPGSAKPPA